MKTLREMMDFMESAQTVDSESTSHSTPLTNDEIMQIKARLEAMYGILPPLEFAWAIEEAHGITPHVKEEQIKETEADPVRRIEELFRDK
jgi:hypothetical protein